MRPSKITPEIASKIADLRRQPYASTRAIHRALEADGVRVSLRTLGRFLGRQGAVEDLPAGVPVVAAPPQSDDLSGDERFTPEALVSDIRNRYLEAKGVADSLHARARIGGPESRKYFEAVRLAADLAERLASMAPPTPVHPDNDPANLAAHRRLLDRVREVAARIKGES